MSNSEKQVKELQEKQKRLLKNTCGECKNFHQHYGGIGDSRGGYFELNCGHCVKPRIKHRELMTKASSHLRKENKGNINVI